MVSVYDRLIAQLDEASHDELHEPLDEVSKELRMLGIDPGPLLERVREEVSHLDANVRIAQTMDISLQGIRKRLVRLGSVALVGLAGDVATGAALLSGLLATENETLVAGVLLLGFTGVLVAAVLAFAQVLWEAFIHQALLAEAAREEVAEFTSAVNALRSANPPFAHLIAEHFSKYARLKYRVGDSSACDSMPAH